jgi:hypothetical protein
MFHKEVELIKETNMICKQIDANKNLLYRSSIFKEIILQEKQNFHPAFPVYF